MIEVKHLTKRYGNHTAVSDLSFTIEKGQIYGFLGPNGAGKSTTMNIMTGCLAASSGEVKIDGHDIFEEAAAAKKLIGYLPEQPPLYLDRTPREYLTFVAEVKGVPAKQRRDEVDRVMGITQITDVADRLIKNLSKGYKQRVGIAQAILGDPEIIILDEPTVGLDPRQIIEIRDLIRSLGETHTVILSSHILSEVQEVCQTILIISQGKLVACDTPENLKNLFTGSATVKLVTDANENEIPNLLAPIPGITKLGIERKSDSRWQVTLEIGRTGDEVNREIFFAFANAERAIYEMTTAKASLEDIFIELTSGDGEEAAETEEEKRPDPEEPAQAEESEANGE